MAADETINNEGLEADEMNTDAELTEINYDELSEEVQALVDALEAERDEALGARQRALADYANFQRRATENEKRARQDGGTSILRSLIPVLDHFDRALEQPPTDDSVGSFLEGMRMVRDELWRALQANSVSEIAPEPGTEFDPNRHQALMRVPTDEYDAGSIVAVMQRGYARGDYVLRAASVSVAATPEAGAQEEGA